MTPEDMERAEWISNELQAMSRGQKPVDLSLVALAAGYVLGSAHRIKSLQEKLKLFSGVDFS